MEHEPSQRGDPSKRHSIVKWRSSLAERSPIRRWQIMLMAALVLPVFLETLDYTVVATAQVHIASVFNRLDLQSYIGTTYLLTSTVFLPLFASFADIFGRHWALQLSLVLFMSGSAVSTGSENMPTMLAGRGIAGIGAAGLLAVVRIILTDSRSLDQTNWQQTMLFLLYTVGYCVGPAIGGALSSVSFRWIFAINLPCCLVAIPLCFFLLRNRTKGAQQARRRHPMSSLITTKESLGDLILRVDWIGAVLFWAGGILVLLALNWGSTQAWRSARVIVCFIVGVLLLAACIFWQNILERQATSSSPRLARVFWANPLVPIPVFRSLDVCIVEYAAMVNGMIMLVMFYFVSIFMVIVTGLSPTKAGVQLLYFAPGMGCGSIISIITIRWFRQPKIPIVLGAIIGTTALGLISMAMDHNNQHAVDGFLVMSGAGAGLTMGALGVHARFSQPENRIAIVSALILFFRSLGGTIGLAQCGAVMNSRVKRHIRDIIESGTLPTADIAALTQIGASAGITSLQSINALPPNVQASVRDAFREGTRWSFISLIPWAAASFIAVLFLETIEDSSRIRRQSEMVEEKTETGVGGGESRDVTAVITV